jgi:phosphatidylethanolamine-binding protein (PEBP) family uncharacterized protein
LFEIMRVLLDLPQTYQRLSVLATSFLLLVACGDKGTQVTLPTAQGGVKVTLPWRDGGSIPRQYTCDGANRRPAVRVKANGPPSRIAIVMTDPDAPGGTFVHWTRWGTTEGRNSFGKTGYDGPCPPTGDSPHRYVVTAYVLKKDPGLPAGAEPGTVVAAIGKLATASGRVTGRYGR